MYKKKLIVAMLLSISMAVCGCQTVIEPAAEDSTEYSTSNAMSALEYSIFMSRQLTIVTNQINSRMIAAKNSQSSTSKTEKAVAEQSREEVQDVYNSVESTRPAKTYQDTRDTTLLVLSNVITHFDSYIDDLENEEDVSGYASIFSNDFNEVTNLANLYNQ